LIVESAIRLTTARYYTPTGRSIQKPYGIGIDYEEEFYQRYENGELEIQDSIHVVDSLKFITPGGNTVYGGGGIVPDIFVPFDTTYRTPYFTHVIYSGAINDFAFDYADKHRSELKAISPDDEGSYFVDGYELSDAIFSSFLKYTAELGFVATKEDLRKSEAMVKNRLKALIGRNIWGNEIYYKILNQMDTDIDAALKVAKEEEES